MIQKFKNKLAILVSALLISVPVAVPATAAYALSGGGNCNNNISSNVAQGASTASGGSFGCGSTGVNNDNIANIAKNIVNIFSIIVGGVAVIMLIYGGFRYITSGGASEKVGNAKNTLIYAIVGLVIVALAQLIVHFVLFQSSTITTSQ